MFEAIVTILGLLGTIVMAVMKARGGIDCSWWTTLLPFGIGVFLALLKNGFDVGDLVFWD